MVRQNYLNLSRLKLIVLRSTQWRVLFLLLLSCFSFSSTPTLAAKLPKDLEGVGITEHLGEQLSINELLFRDDEGSPVVLGKYFKENRPVILAFVYYGCPSLCNLLLNGLEESLHKFDWTTGDQFEFVAVSMNPLETPELAAKKKANYLKRYNRPKAGQGWHFLTGEEEQIKKLASQIGFQYRYDETQKQYIHAAALYILTPQGKISRYLYGISFTLKDLRFSLMDAAHERIGSVVDQILLFCFHFDPNRNSYTFHMWRVVQVLLCFQVVGITLFIFLLWKKDKKRVTQTSS